jgi:hypothetical protein
MLLSTKRCVVIPVRPGASSPVLQIRCEFGMTSQLKSGGQVDRYLYMESCGGGGQLINKAGPISRTRLPVGSESPRGIRSQPLAAAFATAGSVAPT